MKIINEIAVENDKYLKNHAVGIKIEHEHLPTLNRIKDFYEDSGGQWPSIELVAEWIADDHEKEFIDYYDNEIGLPEMERRLKK